MPSGGRSVPARPGPCLLLLGLVGDLELPAAENAAVPAGIVGEEEPPRPTHLAAVEGGEGMLWTEEPREGRLRRLDRDGRRVVEDGEAAGAVIGPGAVAVAGGAVVGGEHEG